MCRNLNGLRLGQRWIPEDAPDDGRGIILPLSMMGLGDMTLKNSPLFPNIGGLLPCSLQSPIILRDDTEASGMGLGISRRMWRA